MRLSIANRKVRGDRSQRISVVHEYVFELDGTYAQERANPRSTIETSVERTSVQAAQYAR